MFSGRQFQVSPLYPFSSHKRFRTIGQLAERKTFVLFLGVSQRSADGNMRCWCTPHGGCKLHFSKLKCTHTRKYFTFESIGQPVYVESQILWRNIRTESRKRKYPQGLERRMGQVASATRISLQGFSSRCIEEGWRVLTLSQGGGCKKTSIFHRASIRKLLKSLRSRGGKVTFSNFPFSLFVAPS